MADASGLHVAAGPTETTSIGNLIMQLKAAGEIKSLKEGRKISNNSSDVHIFEPDISNRTKWDEHFNKYLKFINN
jgi:sugar (pentulose or hexulose) kinase